MNHENKAYFVKNRFYTDLCLLTTSTDKSPITYKTDTSPGQQVIECIEYPYSPCPTIWVQRPMVSIVGFFGVLWFFGFFGVPQVLWVFQVWYDGSKLETFWKVKVVLQGSPSSPDIHYLSEYQRLYDLYDSFHHLCSWRNSFEYSKHCDNFHPYLLDISFLESFVIRSFHLGLLMGRDTFSRLCLVNLHWDHLWNKI